MGARAIKVILVLLLLLGGGLLAIQLEKYSAGRRLERFLAQTRQITAGMTEVTVVNMLGEPSERAAVRANDREHEACRNVGAARILSYRFEYGGWFKGFGISTASDTFSVCLDNDGRAIKTNHFMLSSRGSVPETSG